VTKQMSLSPSYQCPSSRLSSSAPCLCRWGQEPFDTHKLNTLMGLWWALEGSNLRRPPCEGGTLGAFY
jgi:hypothetical protein